MPLQRCPSVVGRPLRKYRNRILSFVVEAKKERAEALPMPTLATVFEVVADGKVYHVAGAALQRWIVERRQKLNGPKGYLFGQRPGLV